MTAKDSSGKGIEDAKRKLSLNRGKTFALENVTPPKTDREPFRDSWQDLEHIAVL